MFGVGANSIFAPSTLLEQVRAHFLPPLYQVGLFTDEEKSAVRKEDRLHGNTFIRNAKNNVVRPLLNFLLLIYFVNKGFKPVIESKGCESL